MYGCRSRHLTSNIISDGELEDGRSLRGKHAKRDTCVLAGAPDGEKRYDEDNGDTSGYFRAVFWFAT